MNEAQAETGLWEACIAVECVHGRSGGRVYKRTREGVASKSEVELNDEITGIESSMECLIDQLSGYVDPYEDV